MDYGMQTFDISWIGKTSDLNIVVRCVDLENQARL